MKNQIRYGRLQFFSFVILDVVCLLLANELAFRIYLHESIFRNTGDYQAIIAVMAVIDVLVTLAFNSLNRALRRDMGKELQKCLEHVVFSFVFLALVLFTLKQGAVYSRVTLYLAYIFDFILIVAVHTLWKLFLKLLHGRRGETVLLMTTDAFAAEGIEELAKKDAKVRGIFLLKNLQQDQLCDLPVMKSTDEASAMICWQWIDRVCIYGLDHQMVPEALAAQCSEMNVPIDEVAFDYRVLNVKTIRNENPRYGSLSFLEGQRDIPFPIRRVYWITETEASLHRGFHAHKLNCQLLFCPYGVIDIILDDGTDRKTVRLDEPGKGLLLMPGLWREMVWQESGSVLCVLASEYYDPDEYIRDYDDYIAYSKKYKD